jgi:hypothetical protein
MREFERTEWFAVMMRPPVVDPLDMRLFGRRGKHFFGVSRSNTRNFPPLFTFSHRRFK